MSERQDDEDMDDATAAGIWGRGTNWARKTNWSPGMPTDPRTIPTLSYQVLSRRVYMTRRWGDGSTQWGEVRAQALRNLIGTTEITDGFYDACGNYLGATWVDEEAWSEAMLRIGSPH